MDSVSQTLVKIEIIVPKIVAREIKNTDLS